MQIKTTGRCHLTPGKMYIILKKKKKKREINAGEGAEKRESLYTVGKNVIWCSHYEKQYEDSKIILK